MPEVKQYKVGDAEVKSDLDYDTMFVQTEQATHYNIEDCKTKTSHPFRTMETGATRDSDKGKLEYNRYIHPLCDFSYAKYMQTKQIIGGKHRRGDNRQKGLGSESLFDSLCRHIEILKLLMYGYTVIEYKLKGDTKLFVDTKDEYIDKFIDMCNEDNIEYDIKEIESELNAIRFNSEGLKLDILLDRFNYNKGPNQQET